MGYAMVWEWRLGMEAQDSLELQSTPLANKQVFRQRDGRGRDAEGVR